MGVVLSLLCGLWMLGTGCQTFEEPVCQRCETTLHCGEGDVCYGLYNFCIPKGTCYCSQGQTTCESLLCEDSGNVCYHPSNQTAGTCSKPQSCAEDRDCPNRMVCLHRGGEGGVCQFSFLCTLPKECDNGDTRECTTDKPGLCSLGLQICQSGRWLACVPTEAQQEVCNGKDDNCDGKVDNGLVCVVTLAGAVGGGDYVDGNNETARFHSPRGIAADSSGVVYVADTRNHCIRKIDAKGNVTTLAGSGQVGAQDGKGTQASFHAPIGLVVDTQGNLYVADSENHKIRKITPSGVVSTLAGGVQGLSDGTGEQARFRLPIGLTMDNKGNLYVADSGNHSIRKVTPEGEVLTLAGTGNPGYRDGSSDLALFNSPRGLVWSNDGSLYISDSGSHVIRWLDSFGQVHTLAGSFQKNDWVDDAGSRARFNSPGALFLDSSSLWVADVDNHNIRRVNLQGKASTVAGKGTGGFKNGDALEAQFRFPWAIARDSKGRIVVADTENNCIRAIVSYPL